jgi:hypothetical protein
MKKQKLMIRPSYVVGAALICASNLMAQSYVGLWDFNSRDLTATVGPNMTYADAGGATEQATRFGSTTELSIPDIAGSNAVVMAFAANTNGMGYLAPTPSGGNGEGSLVNNWTLIFDVFYPSSSAGSLRPISDSDPVNPVYPGPEFAVFAAGGIGIPGRAAFGNVTAGAWHRIAIVNTAATITFYIDGSPVGGSEGGGVDGRFALAPSENLLLFGTIQTDAAPGYVNSVELRNAALTSGQVAALGGPSGAGIPETIPPVPSFVEKWTPPGAVANRNTPVGAVINRGETTINTDSIGLKLDAVPLTQLQITENAGLVTVLKTGLAPFSPGTSHTLELTYTDSLHGAQTNTHQFKAALFWEDFEELTLQDSVEEPVSGTNVWTPVPPSEWTVDNSRMPGYGDPENDGRTEWAGWTFAKKSFWISADNQTRDQFTLGTGVLAIADPDEWDDAAHPTTDENGNSLYYYSFLKTPPIDITGMTANAVFVKFDSSWRPEGFDDWGGTNNQTGTLTVSYDGGPPIEILHYDSQEGGPFYKPDSQNEPVFLQLSNPTGATNMVLTFGLTKAANDWWWAFDNLEVNAGAVAPAITIQPESQVVSAGGNVSLTVAASGSEPLSYQWYFQNALAANGTQSTLSLSNVQTNNAGSYYAVVTNSAGSVTSRVAVLSIFSGSVTQDLVTHLKLDSSYEDASDRGNNGTAVGAPTFETGKIGQAVHINSADSGDPNNFVTLFYPADLKFGSGDTATDFSIAFWVKVNAHDGDKPYASNKDWDSGDNRGWVIANNGSGMEWNWRDDQSERRDSPDVGSQLNDGNWHHIAVTFDRSDLARIYIDGQWVDSSTIAPDPGKPIGSVDTDDLTMSINFGQDGTGQYGSTLDALMDDVGIWRRLITSQEVAAIYNAGLNSNDLSMAIVGAPAIPPTFTTEPQDVSGFQGDVISFNSQASGTPPLAYQWYFNSAPLTIGTQAVYTITSLASTNAGSYFVVASNEGGSITSRVATLTYSGPAPAPTVTGQWDFDFGDLRATVGNDLTNFNATVGADTQFGTTTQFGIPDIAGLPAKVLYYVPSVDTWGGYIMPHGAVPNAGGTKVNRYTLIYDVLYPASSDGQWRSLLQTDPGDSGDGDFFINNANGIGISGNYTGTVASNTWTRIVAVFDLAERTLKKYINGTPAGQQTLDSGLDGRWSLGPVALLFADEDGETNPGYVNSIQFRNGLMTDAEVAALGGVTGNGIPLPEQQPVITSATKVGSDIVITWEGAPGLRLQQNASLSSEGWTEVPGTAGANSATIPIGAGPAFFRLVR